VDIGTIVGASGAVLNAYGKWLSGKVARAQGDLQRAGARIQADEMRQAAKQALAAGQQNALEELRQARLAQSRALVMSAAGGGSSADPTIVNIISSIAEEGSRRAGVHMQNARQEAGSIRMDALTTEFGGANAAAAGRTAQAGHNLGASTTLLREGVSLYSKYGGQSSAPAAKPSGGTSGDFQLIS
jgi:hypothetical protein